MTEKLRLRCSALPMAFLCGGSVRRGELEIDEAHESAYTGRAAHEGHAQMVGTGSVDWDAVPELARRYDVNEKELRALLGLGQRLWNQIRDSFPNASAEVSLSYGQELAYEDQEFVLTGHVDVLGFSGGIAYPGDWKDGRVDKPFAQQILGYCFLVLMTWTEISRAQGGIMWVRENEFEPYSMTREQAAEWLERLRAEVVRWDGVYRPGNHCTHCRRSHDCVARKALVRRDVEVFSDNMTVARVEDETALMAMTPDEIVEVLVRADRVRLFADRVREAIRDHVIRNGEVTGSQYKLALQHEERRGLDTRAAWPVIESMLDDEQMPEVIEVKISKVEDLVAKAAGKGKGAAAKRQLQQALDDAGAINTTTITKLSVRRAT
jgi:hypothetical protein